MSTEIRKIVNLFVQKKGPNILADIETLFLISKIKTRKVLKKNYFYLLFSCIFWSCAPNSDEPNISKNLVSEIFKVDSDGNIARAQKQLGKLHKEKRKFVDPKSGTFIEVIYGAVSKDLLDQYFETFDISIRGVSQSEIDEVKSQAMKPVNGREGANLRESGLETYDPDGVYYDLSAKSISPNDAGYVFTISPKPKSGKNSKTKGFNYRQQTSLAFCELAVISKLFTTMPGSTTPKKLWFREQVRGIFWNTRMDWLLEMNNDHVNAFDIDGPKFTRFGTEFDYDRWGISWWDAESDENINIDYIPLP